MCTCPTRPELLGTPIITVTQVVTWLQRPGGRFLESCEQRKAARRRRAAPPLRPSASPRQGARPAPRGFRPVGLRPFRMCQNFSFFFGPLRSYFRVLETRSISSSRGGIVGPGPRVGPIDILSLIDSKPHSDEVSRIQTSQAFVQTLSTMSEDLGHVLKAFL